MAKRIRKHIKFFPIIKRPTERNKEQLRKSTGNFPLNTAQTDRISFSVLRNDKNRIRVIENIWYEINIDGKWEWVVRYDDHGGSGPLHRHYRISLKDNKEIDSAIEVKRFKKNKDHELTWCCKDIGTNYLDFRRKFLKNNGLDLY